MKSSLKSPLLSVIVPVGNMVGQLRFIESWLHETDKYRIEVILVHDQTYREVRPHLDLLLAHMKLSNVKMIEGFFGNPGGARNAGLNIAKGEWVAFWDSDDNPNIKNTWEAVQRADERDEILIGNFTVFDLTSLTSRPPTRHADALNSVTLNPGIWRMIFRSETLSTTRFPEIKMGEDQVFLSYLRFASRRLSFIESVFYQYNIGGASQLTKSRSALRDLPIASRLIFDHAKTASKKDSIFDLRLFHRQQITLLKKGDFLMKLSILEFFGKLLVPPKMKLIGNSLTALTLVLKTIRKSGL